MLDVYRPAMDVLLAEGAVAGSSTARTAAEADVLITMLPDSQQVRSAYM